MQRLQKIAQAAKQSNRKLLAPYLVAGDPNLKTTLALMHTLVEKGADVIELGYPFSDPSSDGPVIQRGVERALQGGASLQDTLDLVRQFRETNQNTAIVLMGYLNPIEIMGYEKFTEQAIAAGVDATLIVDMPPAESHDLQELLRKAGLDTIYLVAPTTSEARAKDIIAHCSGYLYYVALKGVTGAALSDSGPLAARVETLRTMTDLPIVIGFGIKDADSARVMGAISDGIAIGSALVDKIGGLDADAVPGQETLDEVCQVIALARQALDSLE